MAKLAEPGGHVYESFHQEQGDSHSDISIKVFSKKEQSEPHFRRTSRPILLPFYFLSLEGFFNDIIVPGFR